MSLRIHISPTPQCFCAEWSFGVKIASRSRADAWLPNWQMCSKSCRMPVSVSYEVTPWFWHRLMWSLSRIYEAALTFSAHTPLLDSPNVLTMVYTVCITCALYPMGTLPARQCRPAMPAHLRNLDRGTDTKLSCTRDQLWFRALSLEVAFLPRIRRAARNVSLVINALSPPFASLI